MKVEGPLSARQAGPGRKAERKSGGASFSHLLEGEEAHAPTRSAAAAPTPRVDALLALQEVGDAMGGRRRAVRRANDLLDRLDALRLALLDGQVPPATLRELAQMVGAERPLVTDPALIALLDDIDLRVQVELAKFDRDA